MTDDHDTPARKITLIGVSTVTPITEQSRDTREMSRSHYRTNMPLGVLDDHARTAFTRGQCHSLAAALAEQDGWGDVVVIAARNSYRGRHSDDEVVHCYAVNPDGDWVDANGVHEPEGALAAWKDTMETVDPDGESVHIEQLTTDAAGARALATYAGSRALTLDVETPLLPTSMRLARSVVPLVRSLGQ
jgi:hypothetical protein